MDLILARRALQLPLEIIRNHSLTQLSSGIARDLTIAKVGDQITLRVKARKKPPILRTRGQRSHIYYRRKY